MTFEEFLAGLRALEASGEIEVVKWPETEDDTFRARVLKDTPRTRVMRLEGACVS